MRSIGSVPNETQARVFADFLVAKGIRNQVESEADGHWLIWIYEDDQIPAAQSCLARFQADPDAEEFRRSIAEAARVRRAEAQELEAYRKRIRTGRSVFPKMGNYGVGLLTYGLIVVCVIVAIRSRLGDDHEFLRSLFISDPENPTMKFLPEVFHGEVWRLFTPIFIHFGLAHLIFNMMCLYQLGCMIEARQSSLYLFVLVAVFAVGSNVAQYYFGGRFHFGHITVFIGSLSATFGGMSGVVYGLAGYVWIRGKYDRAAGLFLHPRGVTILLVWLVVCYTGAMGPVANTAHLAGLLMGMAWGWISAWLVPKRRG